MAVIGEFEGHGVRLLIEEVKQKSPIIQRFELESGADRDGYAAVWVTLVIPDSASPVGDDGRLKEDATEPGGLLSVVGEIEQIIKRNGFVPNVHFRTESEQELVENDRAERSS